MDDTGIKFSLERSAWSDDYKVISVTQWRWSSFSTIVDDINENKDSTKSGNELNIASKDYFNSEQIKNLKK